MKPLTKRQKQAINTKLKITEVAIDLYRTKDIETVSVQDICNAAGISIGAFYHHFKSKDEILNTSYQQVDLLLRERIEDQDFPNATVEILAFFKTSSLILNDLGWLFVSGVYRNLFNTPDKYTYLDERYVNQAIKAAITNGIASGEYKSDINPNTLKDTIMRLGRGAIFDWCLREGQSDLEACLTQDISLVLNAASTKSTDYPNQGL